METTTRGGPRKGSGRNPIVDKKKQVYVMIRQSAIENLGGMEAVKKILEEAVENRLKNISLIQL